MEGEGIGKKVGKFVNRKDIRRYKGLKMRADGKTIMERIDYGKDR